MMRFEYRGMSPELDFFKKDFYIKDSDGATQLLTVAPCDDIHNERQISYAMFNQLIKNGQLILVP